MDRQGRGERLGSLTDSPPLRFAFLGNQLMGPEMLFDGVGGEVECLAQAALSTYSSAAGD